jgi:hypothetical protein
MILRINHDYFPKQHLQIGVCNVDALFSVRQEMKVETNYLDESIYHSKDALYNAPFMTYMNYMIWH